MAKAIRITLLLLLAFTLAACGSNIRRGFGGGSSDARAMILRDRPAVEISIWEGAIVFDLRDYGAYAQGHIHGARLATVEDLQRGRGLPEDKKAPVLFMGEGPLDAGPETAAVAAIEQGYSNVQIYPGGWRDWIGHDSVGE